MRKFGDALFQRVRFAAYKIASDNREVPFQFVGHANGTAYLRCGHVGANVNIAELSDAHPVERGRKIGDWNFDFTHGKLKPLGHKSVGGAYERHRARDNSSSLEKISARVIDVFFRCADAGGGQDWARRHRAPALAIFSSGPSRTLPQPLKAAAAILMSR